MLGLTASVATRWARFASSSSKRSISIGTDMISSVISLQKARPWYMTDADGSNQAVDNAVTMKELFEGRTVAIFGVPAPFTGVCTNAHYPPYQELADSLMSNGIDKIVCYSVSDPYAMDGWQRALKNDPEKIQFLADPDSTFANAYGVDAKYESCSLGSRSIRFSMIVKDGIVTTFQEVEDAASDAANLLDSIKEISEAA